MADVFISYTRTDRASVKMIAECLEAEKITVWWDPDLNPGEVFDSEIERQLADASCVIVVWSSRSVGSRWVRSEASVGDDRRVLIPVMIERVKLPIAFRLLQTEDLSTWLGERDAEVWQRIVLQVKALLGAPAANLVAAATARDHHGAANPGGVVLQATVAPLIALMFLGATLMLWSQRAGWSLATTLGLAALALMLFRVAEHDLSPQMKALARRWLLPEEGIFEVGTAEAFNHLFEAVFGRHHFSAECFVKSTVISLVFFHIVVFIAALLFLDKIEWRPSSLIVIFFFGLFVNSLGDYVALLKTRLLLRLYKVGWNIILVVMIDVVGLLTIFAAAAAIAVLLVYGIYYLTGANEFYGTAGYLAAVKTSVTEVLSQPLIDIFRYNPGVKSYPLEDKILIYSAFVTTCMTSLWLWLALLLSPIIRVLLWSRVSGLTLLGFIFDVYNAPFAAMGYLSALVILLSGALFWGANEVVAAFTRA